jgi:hypothetical protein
MTISPMASPLARSSTPTSLVTVFAPESEADSVSVHGQPPAKTHMCCCVWCCLRVYNEQAI